MEISRREFLKYLGITGAGITLAGCDSIWSVPDEIYEKVGGMPGIETWKTSVCSLCPGGCGIKVRLIDGIPVRIHGNPIHPVNRGGICPMAEAGIEALFNPDRVKSPLMRLGERGENRWESITWDEAIQIVGGRLQKLSEQNESHKLAFFADHGNTLLTDLIDRFMLAYGSPNVFFADENHSSNLTTYITQGHKNTIGHDFKDVKLLLNFGADLLDAGPSPIRFNQIYSQLRNPENGQRARIIHIGSRFSRTAANSSEWIPIQPGTSAALALSMANVLIKDGQYDKRFIKNDSFGFDDWQDKNGNIRKGFKTLVRLEYYPEKVSQITGVPESRIVELAREFGAQESALVLAGGDAANSSNGLYTLWAVECLNALKGNYRSGGPFSLQKNPPFTALPKIQMNKEAEQHVNLNQADSPFCLSDHINTGLNINMLTMSRNKIDTLLLTNVNPVFNSVNPAQVVDALNNIPFIVSFASCVDETSVYADLIMPDHIFLEKNEAVYNVPAVDFSYVSMQQQVIEPIFDTRHTGDVLLQMSKSMGGALSAALPWPDYKTYLKNRVEGIYKTGAGTIFTERMDEAWLKYLKERGWQIFDYTTFDEFWDVLLESGGWWDPFPEKTNFSAIYKTPSKKFEFYSQILEKEVNSKLNAKPGMDINSLLLKWKISESGDTVYLPHFEPLQYETTDNKLNLHLLTYPLLTNINGSGSNLPLVQELFGLLTREYWQSWVEINPDTAHEHGVDDGDMVKITSKVGSLVAKAKIHPAVMPEVIQIPFGQGHKVYGRYAKDIGVNPYEILAEEYDFLSGRPSLISTKAMIQKVNGKERV